MSNYCNIDEICLTAVKEADKGRKIWRSLDGHLVTVEEVAQSYYVRERGYNNCLIDTACLYGGLSWLLFHEILFHNNLSSKQPLCTQYFHTPKRFYERHQNTIEEKLLEYSSNRPAVFDRQLETFLNHPFFSDSKSKIAPYHGK